MKVSSPGPRWRGNLLLAGKGTEQRRHRISDATAGWGGSADALGSGDTHGDKIVREIAEDVDHIPTVEVVKVGGRAPLGVPVRQVAPLHSSSSTIAEMGLGPGRELCREISNRLAANPSRLHVVAAQQARTVRVRWHPFRLPWRPGLHGPLCQRPRQVRTF